MRIASTFASTTCFYVDSLRFLLQTQRMSILETRPLAKLSRPQKYMLAANADADVRIVEGEWSRWLQDLPAGTPVRERIRRVALEMGLTVETGDSNAQVP